MTVLKWIAENPEGAEAAVLESPAGFPPAGDPVVLGLGVRVFDSGPLAVVKTTITLAASDCESKVLPHLRKYGATLLAIVSNSLEVSPDFLRSARQYFAGSVAASDP